MAVRHKPLTESYFYILLCLYHGPKHGYGIMQQILELSGGQVQIGAGTLYGATTDLLQKDWIREVPPVSGGYEQRRQYALTDEGRKTLLEEMDRLERMERMASLVRDHIAGGEEGEKGNG
ncbi:MAG: PadR family transcriptional regulator [Clostridiales bacterium]|nr:PadR family transcriptional regulator [Clostridiales bacterium]